MTAKMTLAALVLITTLAGCTAEQAYNAAQDSERSKCVKGPANAYQQCLDRANMSYQEYEAKRSEGKENQP